MKDENGYYLIEFSCDGEEAGETILCQYIRRRESRVNSEDDRIGSQQTKVDLIYYHDGQIFDGVEYAEYDEGLGKWKIK